MFPVLVLLSAGFLFGGCSSADERQEGTSPVPAAMIPIPLLPGEAIHKRFDLTLEGTSAVLIALREPRISESPSPFNSVRLYIQRENAWVLVDSLTLSNLQKESSITQGDLSGNGQTDFLIRDEEKVEKLESLCVLEPTTLGLSVLFPFTPHCRIENLDEDDSKPEIIVEERYFLKEDPKPGFWYITSINALKENHWVPDDARFLSVYEARGEAAFKRYSREKIEFNLRPGFLRFASAQRSLLLAFAEAALSMKQGNAEEYESFVKGEAPFLKKSLTPTLYNVIEKTFPTRVSSEKTETIPPAAK